MSGRSAPAIVLFISLVCGACSALTDFDRFSSGPGELNIQLRQMSPHLAGLFQLDLISGESSSDGFLRARILQDPLGLADADVVLPGAVPPDEELYVDFFGDLNGDRTYDAPPTDHSWREDLDPDGELFFTHTIDFDELDCPRSEPSCTDFCRACECPAMDESCRFPRPIGGDFAFTLTGMEAQIGRAFEARLYIQDSGRAVGLYRLGEIPAGEFTVTIPGVVDAGNQFRIDFYSDVNGDRQPDSQDVACRISRQAGSADLEVTWPFDPADCGVRL